MTKALQPCAKPGILSWKSHVPTAYDLGAEFYRWEFATAVACHILGVNAFDQPNVEDAKLRAKSRIAAYQENGRIGSGRICRLAGCQTGCLDEFLSGSKNGDYIAIMAFLPRENEMINALQDLRVAIRDATKRAVTLGFGPRFLHSTGQLHKGGANNGLFLQITADPVEDIEIPTQGYVIWHAGTGPGFGRLRSPQIKGAQGPADPPVQAGRGSKDYRADLKSSFFSTTCRLRGNSRALPRYTSHLSILL